MIDKDWVSRLEDWAREAAAERRASMPDLDPIVASHGTAIAALQLAYARVEAGASRADIGETLVRGLLGAAALMGPRDLIGAAAIVRHHMAVRPIEFRWGESPR
jgi:hypothetical protein